MNKYSRYVLYVLVLLLLILWIFKVWFFLGPITGTDFWYSFRSMYSNRPLYLLAWDSGSGGGFGGFTGPLLWAYLNFGIPTTILGVFLGFQWNVVERVFYLYPFLIFSFGISFFIWKSIFKNRIFAIFSSLVFVLNTYILMIVGGGQLAIALAYSITPLIIFIFLTIFNNVNHKRTILYLLAGILFATQIFFDLRIAYVTGVAIGILWLIKIIENKKLKYFLFVSIPGLTVPLFITSLLNMYWILPSILVRQNPVVEFGSAYTSLNAVRFFSFAKFENTISLLHPNWPENIFGKVDFMRPEFLIIPILAFTSLLFIKNESRERKFTILAFALIGLVGAFLAKGANDPFGGIYLWTFIHVPGFIMFRDPTKWYVLVALSYSVLIPYTVWKIYEWLKSKKKFSIDFFNSQNLFVLLFILFWIFTIRQAFLAQLDGTFKTTSVPNDYVKLENFLNSQKDFSRTFWVPSTQRFSFYSNTHPAISALTLYNETSISGVLKKFSYPQTEKILQKSAVKYVIVPYDSQEELFIKDREYDNSQYQDTVMFLEHIPWLKEIHGFNKVKVFQVPNQKKHFWLDGSGSVTSTQINPTKYEVKISNAKKGEALIFSGSYDKNWQLTINGENISSVPYQKSFNSFVLPASGSFDAQLSYQPQRWVDIGMIISSISFIIFVGLLSFFIIKHDDIF